MENNDQSGWKHFARSISRKYYFAIAIVLIIIGLVISFISTIVLNPVLSRFIEEVGIFLSAVIAVSLIYDTIIKGIERQFFLSDLKAVLDIKLSDYSLKSNLPTIYESGRLELRQKVEYLNRAESEYFEVGISLATLANYFHSRSPVEFKDHVIEQLKKGVNFKFVLLDPDSDIAAIYEKDRNESNRSDKIKHTIEEFRKLGEEFAEAEYEGTFSVYVYSHLPCYSIQFVDPSTDNGRALISHYLYGVRNAQLPVIEISKSANQNMFETYYHSVQCLCKNWKKVV